MGLSLASLLCALCRYGVGQIYFRQEKYEMAEYQFKRALQVNCVIDILPCCPRGELQRIWNPC